MYYYRNPRGGRKHPRNIYAFPWFLFVILFFNFHSLTWILISVGLMLLLNLFIRSLATSKSSAGTTANTVGAQQTYYQPSQQPYQPYQQQYQPYYQPQEPYQAQSYEQGYQASQENRNEGVQQYQYPETAEYDQYEQPQAQYPEQMPPMQQ